MGDFKTANVEGYGKRHANGMGGISYILMIVLLGGTGLLGAHKAGWIGRRPASGTTS